MKNKSLFSVLLIGTALLAACQSAPAPTSSQNQAIATTNQNNAMPSIQTEAPAAGDTVAILDTDKGTIKLKLFTELAPETTKNFIELANSGKYNGVPFHRVIEGFMIQTGDFTRGDGRGGHSYLGPDTTIADEFSPSLKNLRGAVSMANSGPNSNGSQFFIVTAADGTPWLDNRHSVFGQVYEGLDVAEAISRLPRNALDAPLEPVTIKSVTISTL
jgi:cyclophilin family peptidyl-prolyl cis-trans isomerase